MLATATFFAATGVYGSTIGGHWPAVGAWAGTLSLQAVQAAGVDVRAVSFEGLAELSERTLMRDLFEGDVLTRSSTTTQIRDRLLANPWIAHAEVQRLFPDRLVVMIEERTPVAILQDEDLQLVARDGTRLGRLEGRRFGALPVIAGPDAFSASRELTPLMRAGAWLPSAPRGAVRVGERRWNLVLEDGSKILLPTVNPIAALDGLRSRRSVDAALAGALLTGRPIVLDLRNMDRIVFSAQHEPDALDEDMPT